jgi:hypothetical protein
VWPSRRDWFLLPLICLGTAAVVLVGAELGARQIWYEKRESNCVLRGHHAFYLFRPGCTQTDKWFETAPIAATYNDCGYRTAEPCKEEQPGQRRGVLLGTSIAAGYMVDYPHSFAALSSEALRRACGRPADLQNLGIVSETGYLRPMMTERLRDVGGLRPDFIVLVLSTYDFTHKMDPIASGGAEPPHDVAGALMGAHDWLVHYVQYRSHLFAVLRELAFHSSSFFLKSKFDNQDDYGFMNEPDAPRWRSRAAELERLVAEVSTKARSLSVPLLIMYVPTEPEVRLPANQSLVKHPNVLEDDLARLAQEDGAMLVPLPAELRRHADEPDLYYHADGHPAAGAHAIMADALTRSILADVPLFRDCRGSLPTLAASGAAENPPKPGGNL